MGWTLGVLLTLVVFVNIPDFPSAGPLGPSQPLRGVAVFGLLGLSLSLPLGLVQFVAFRGTVSSVARWLLATTLPWALGLPVLLVVFDMLRVPAPDVFSILAAAVVVGIPMGVFQRILLRPRLNLPRLWILACGLGIGVAITGLVLPQSGLEPTGIVSVVLFGAVAGLVSGLPLLTYRQVRYPRESDQAI